MNTKLTLKVPLTLTLRAKKYAKEHKTSLSALVATYFSTLESMYPKHNTLKLPADLKKLAGIAKIKKKKEDSDYEDYLKNKYSV